MAKVEAHRVPGLGSLIRSFGAFPVRRGESDREAVRTMRRIVAEGNPLGLFAEGTRQLSGHPGPVQPGAAMVAIQEGVPIVPAAIHGSQTWAPGNFHPVSLAWGMPMRFDGVPRGGKGYKEASALLEAEIRRLWEWLVDVHRLGRPEAFPPGDASEHDDEHARQRRLRRETPDAPAPWRSSGSRTSASRRWSTASPSRARRSCTRPPGSRAIARSSSASGRGRGSG